MANTTEGHPQIPCDVIEAVASLFGVLPEEVGEVLALDQNQRYNVWLQPKKGGGSRPIHCPVPLLRYIQRSALDNGFGRIELDTEMLHGGIKGQSIVTNALRHVGSRSMVHFDLADAYGQATSFPKIYELQALLGDMWHLNDDVKRLFHELFFVEEPPREKRGSQEPKLRLPQGGPTSPVIFNHYCVDLDLGLWEFAEVIGAIVTRYYDNIVFSWEHEWMSTSVVNHAKKIIRELGFVLNDKKEGRISGGNCEDRPLRLPGVNIIRGELRLDREIVRRFRGALYNALKSDNLTVACGIAGHVHQVYGNTPPKQLAQLLEEVHQRREQFHGQR